MTNSISATDLLLDSYERIRELVGHTAGGLSPEQLAFRPAANANSIGWLIWHLTRVQDDHIADAAGLEQVWTAKGWYDRFDLRFSADATGYGQSAAEVGEFATTADLLIGYHDAVYSQSVDYLRGLSASDLTRVVDEAWDPPVTLAVRLVSVVSDDLQHAGQASYLRGILPGGS